jgi:hypothetical protein
VFQNVAAVSVSVNSVVRAVPSGCPVSVVVYVRDPFSATLDGEICFCVRIS